MARKPFERSGFIHKFPLQVGLEAICRLGVVFYVLWFGKWSVDLLKFSAIHFSVVKGFRLTQKCRADRFYINRFLCQASITARKMTLCSVLLKVNMRCTVFYSYLCAGIEKLWCQYEKTSLFVMLIVGEPHFAERGDLPSISKIVR